ncbi:hypothetical protein WS70_25325 [Burkholderia mayonis]|uniref:Integrase n=2 Tax=Burkholderiaceae TaxID=119060 RepID=A0A1B4FN03_9BURK|nr:hypothetical protein WS70_25325 [Burkholderia mayonis]KVE37155.1 hypothetical protein WS69_03125 [Burkholderia sp. BDU5]KVE45750.1 hypothetical protein WS70_03940 [Burkholderia mayonis]
MVIPQASDERHVYKGRREMLEIARACPNRQARAAIRAAFYSGMRFNEILRAKPTKNGFSLGTKKMGDRESFRSIPVSRSLRAE